jgi:hypothetical protein
MVILKIFGEDITRNNISQEKRCTDKGTERLFVHLFKIPGISSLLFNDPEDAC